MHCKIIRIHVIDHDTYYAWDEEDKCWELIDERYLRKCWDHRYPDLNENARRKSFDRFLKSAGTIKTVMVSDSPTCPEKVRTKSNGKHHRPTQKDLAAGVDLLLGIRNLFSNTLSGLTLLANLLAGAHAEALYSAVGIPGFRMDLALYDIPLELVDILVALEKAVLLRRKHRHGRTKIRLNPVLDFRDGRTHRDFCEISVKTKSCGKIRIIADYLDRQVLFVGAAAEQITGLDVATTRSTRLFINCTLPKACHATRIKTTAVAQVDDAVLTEITENKGAVAAAFDLYRCGIEHERHWAKGVVDAAKERIGVREGRFRSVCYDHRELAQAIRCELLLNYVQLNEQIEFLDAVEAERLHIEISESFYPSLAASAEDTAPRRMEDAETFIEVMRTLEEQFRDRIIPDGERFVKGSGRRKTYGCWRTISAERFLCVPENIWEAEYPRACKAAGVDTSFTDQINWLQKLQKEFSIAGLIRYEGGNNYRHRLDLYGTGKKDTHVVLIPARLLESGESDE